MFKNVLSLIGILILLAELSKVDLEELDGATTEVVSDSNNETDNVTESMAQFNKSDATPQLEDDYKIYVTDKISLSLNQTLNYEIHVEDKIISLLNFKDKLSKIFLFLIF